jgi:hypothetical protein
MFQLKKSTACSLMMVSVSLAFTPNNLASFQQRSSSSSSSSLGVSVVSEYLASPKIMEDAARLKAAFETQTPESVGVKAAGIEQQPRRRRNHRRHDYSNQESFLKEEPDLDFYTLHSSVVSHLYQDMPINDLT